MSRPATDAIIFLAAFLAPLWLSAPIAIIASASRMPFYELIPFGLILDGIHSEGANFFEKFPYTLVAAVIVIASATIKKNLKFY